MRDRNGRVGVIHERDERDVTKPYRAFVTVTLLVGVTCSVTSVTSQIVALLPSPLLQGR